jgi:S-methylmethionine-dependent homocysteine/selenocysteine methylase
VRLTDGGLETSPIFHQHLEVPPFAAFPLVQHQQGRAALREYWTPYLSLAHDIGVPFVVDTATWRANPDWASQLRYDARHLREVNRVAAALARELASKVDQGTVNGVVGPRGDGYVVGDHLMSPDQAAEYHSPQVVALAEAGVEHVTGVSFTYPDEAVGFVRAARAVGVPAIVSFTVETDGRLPNGDALKAAIEQVDHETDRALIGFVINCAHPTHFSDALWGGDWLSRIIGVRGKASVMSHAETGCRRGARRRRSRRPCPALQGVARSAAFPGGAGLMLRHRPPPPTRHQQDLLSLLMPARAAQLASRRGWATSRMSSSIAAATGTASSAPTTPRSVPPTRAAMTTTAPGTFTAFLKTRGWTT